MRGLIGAALGVNEDVAQRLDIAGDRGQRPRGDAVLIDADDQGVAVAEILCHVRSVLKIKSGSALWADYTGCDNLLPLPVTISGQ